MAYILHIETTSTVCSVAISSNEKLLAIKENNEGYSHAENLHLFIQQILIEAKISINELSAISISKGPGSYTGLRIGYSTAKGLCYTLNIPLISINTLKALASSVINQVTLNTEFVFCPMIDARRMEVYSATYSPTLKELEPTSAIILNEDTITRIIKKRPTLCIFGDGMLKAKELIQSLGLKAQYIENIIPSASSLIGLSYQKYLKKEFEDIAYAEPFYLKEFFFIQKK